MPVGLESVNGKERIKKRVRPIVFLLPTIGTLQNVMMAIRKLLGLLAVLS